MAWHDAKGPDLCRGQIGKALVFYLYTLGGAGGTRGIDDIGQLIRGNAFLRRLMGCGGCDFWPGIDQNRGDRWLARDLCLAQRGLGQDPMNLCVVHHPDQPVFRVSWVEGEVGASCFEDAQQTDDHGRRAFDIKTDQDFWSNAQCAQPVCHLLCLTVEFSVGQLHQPCWRGPLRGSRCLWVDIDQRLGGRSLAGLVGKEVMNAQVGWNGLFCGVPVHHHLLLFRARQQRQPANRLCRLLDKPGQQGLPVVGQPCQRGRFEEICVILEGAHQRCTRLLWLFHQQDEIKLPFHTANGQSFQLQCLGSGFGGHCGFGRQFLMNKDCLKDWGTTGIAQWLQLLHQQRKRVRLMGQALQDGLSGLCQQRVKGEIGGDFCAQHDGVDKIPNDAGKVGLCAIAGSWRTNQQCVLTCVAIEQHLIGCQQEGVQGGAFCPCQRTQLLREFQAQTKLAGGAAQPLYGRARVVGGEFQHGQRGVGSGLQLLSPVASQRLPFLAEVIELPVDKIQVGARREWDVLFLLVEGTQLCAEQRDRPVIENDMVQCEQQHSCEGTR